MENNIQYYLNQIDFLIFSEISDQTWETIECEGLDEEKDLFLKTDWEEAFLVITDEDKQLLLIEDLNVLDKFNIFDWELKEKYKMKYIDLIDIYSGQIKIIRGKK